MEELNFRDLEAAFPVLDVQEQLASLRSCAYYMCSLSFRLMIGQRETLKPLAQWVSRFREEIRPLWATLLELTEKLPAQKRGISKLIKGSSKLMRRSSKLAMQISELKEVFELEEKSHAQIRKMTEGFLKLEVQTSHMEHLFLKLFFGIVKNDIIDP